MTLRRFQFLGSFSFRRAGEGAFGHVCVDVGQTVQNTTSSATKLAASSSYTMPLKRSCRNPQIFSRFVLG
jgi:hypothetical protein